MRHHSQSGFTLLEILVALVVLGMLIGGLTQGLRIGVNAWQAQKRQLARRDDWHGAETLLRNLVGRMDPGGVDGLPPRIVGSSRSLTFTTTLPQASEALATQEADVTLAVDDAHRLQLLWLPHTRIRRRPAQIASQVTLLNEVDHLEMGYWQDAHADWVTGWTGPALPRLVRIRIAFSSASGRRAPDIIISPMRDRWRQ